MLPSLHAVRCLRCLGPVQRRSQQNAAQSRLDPLQRLHSRSTLAATDESLNERLTQQSTSRLLEPLSAWHHEAKTSYLCPACGQRIQRLPVLERHFKKCCPDLISQQVWLDVGLLRPCTRFCNAKPTRPVNPIGLASYRQQSGCESKAGFRRY